MNNSAISHEIASLSQALEQHRLQSRAERCDSNTTLQKLQEQTAQLALAVHRLEQAQLNSPEMHGHTGLMPSIGNYMSKHPLIQHPQPSNTHSPKYERAQAVQTGELICLQAAFICFPCVLYCQCLCMAPTAFVCSYLFILVSSILHVVPQDTQYSSSECPRLPEM